MMEVCPPVPPGKRKAPAGESKAETREDAERKPPAPSVSPRRADIEGINGSSSRGSSDSSNSSYDSRTSSDSTNSNNSGNLPAFVGRPPRDTEVFGEPPVL